MTTYTIDNNADILDSRDIIERIAELEEIKRAADQNESDEQGNPTYNDEWNEEMQQELTALNALAKECEEYSSDWRHGETLINRSYFVDYMTQLIHDCYELPKEFNSGNWPFRHMTFDYEAAADEAEQDYASVDFAGVEYLIRSC